MPSDDTPRKNLVIRAGAGAGATSARKTLYGPVSPTLNLERGAGTGTGALHTKRARASHAPPSIFRGLMSFPTKFERIPFITPRHSGKGRGRGRGKDKTSHLPSSFSLNHWRWRSASARSSAFARKSLRALLDLRGSVRKKS